MLHSFLKCFWLNVSQMRPHSSPDASGRDGPTHRTSSLFPLLLKFGTIPLLLPLSLQLHISQRSAFGITPPKSLPPSLSLSLSAVPTAAMTTAGELCVSESKSVIVCLIANLWAVCVCVCVCIVWTHEHLILRSFAGVRVCISPVCVIFVLLCCSRAKTLSLITGRVGTYNSKWGKATNCL